MPIAHYALQPTNLPAVDFMGRGFVGGAAPHAPTAVMPGKPHESKVCCFARAFMICVAVCCGVLRCVAVWCSVLQRVAVCCSVLL